MERVFQILLLSLVASTLGHPTHDNDQKTPSNSFVHLPIYSRNPALGKRYLSSTLANQIRTYLIDVQIGSTGQKSTLSLDTGSADTWILTPETCNGCTGGTYDEAQSTSDIHQTSLGNFDLTYTDGTIASGTYHCDNIVIGNTTIFNATFAMMDKPTNSDYGILGLGLSAQQSSIIHYPTLLDHMKAQGLITSRSYSLQLNAENATSGSIVFGGYDYTYQMMASIPMWTFNDNAMKLAVEWNGLSVRDADGTTTFSQTNTSQPVMLDSGFTLSTLPDDVFDRVSRSFAVKKSGGNYYVPCEQPEGHVEMLFGGTPGITVSVPFSELAIPANLQPGVDEGHNLCMFGFQPVSAWPRSDGMMSFGDTFLRSAYLLVNIDTMMVGLDQANPRVCVECLVPL